ncbi:MAG: MFS transporter [Bifidobacteriaceae bacterium]|jgi:sugar phosphate permease|nr:MFS transporter [Bifidobacteriaceae bacterium]
MKKQYLKYQISVLIGTYLLYTTYTLVRNSFNASTAYLDLNADQVGSILAAIAISYGISRPITGFLADKFSPRIFITLGLIASSIITFGFAWSQNITGLYIIIATLSGVFQSIGSPTSQKILAQWFPKNRRGTIIGIWSTSKDFGKVIIAATVLLCTTFFGATSQAAHSIFILVALIGILIAAISFIIIQNSPQDVKLPALNEHKQIKQNLWQNSKNHVLKNKAVWFLCLAGASSYCATVGMQSWIPMLLQNDKGFSKADATIAYGLFSAGAIPAVLILCFISDAVLKGKRVKLILSALILVFAMVIIYWLSDNPNIIRLSIMLCGALFMGVGGLGVALTVDAVPPFALGTAGGLIGFFEYILGTVLGTKLIGYLINQTNNWSIGFAVILSAIFLEFLCFLGLLGVEKTNYGIK